MPRILITNDATTGALVSHLTNAPVVEVVTLSILDEIYGVRCTGDERDECPDADDLNETWLNREDPVKWAVRHLKNHEAWS